MMTRQQAAQWFKNLRWLHNNDIEYTFTQVKGAFGKVQHTMATEAEDITRLQADNENIKAIVPVVVQKLKDDQTQLTALKQQIASLSGTGANTAALEQIASDQEAGLQQVKNALAELGVDPNASAQPDPSAS